MGVLEHNAVLLLALGLICLCASVHSRNVCANVIGNKYIANPASCSGWIFCQDGREIVRGACSSLYVYNSSAGYCDYPENVKCTTDVTTNPRNNICANRPDRTYAPNPNNCGSYFYCSNNVASEKKCQKAHIVNEAVWDCQYSPNNVCLTKVNIRVNMHGAEDVRRGSK